MAWRASGFGRSTWAALASFGIFLGASTCVYRSSWAPLAPSPYLPGPAPSLEPSFRGSRVFK
eukprot:scaffold7699_cov73-Phaeocystis_antarctica.AAC.1